MVVIGTVERIGSGTSKKGKPYDFLTIAENKAKYFDFGGHINKACVKEGDKVKIIPWTNNKMFIDTLEQVPQSTQTSLEAPTTHPSKEEGKTYPPEREANIEFLAVLKAVSGLPIPLKMLSDTEVQVLADNLINITNKVIELRRR